MAAEWKPEVDISHNSVQSSHRVPIFLGLILVILSTSSLYFCTLSSNWLRLFFETSTTFRLLSYLLDNFYLQVARIPRAMSNCVPCEQCLSLKWNLDIAKYQGKPSKIVRYNEFSLYRGTFPCTLLLLG